MVLAQTEDCRVKSCRTNGHIQSAQCVLACCRSTEAEDGDVSSISSPAVVPPQFCCTTRLLFKGRGTFLLCTTGTHTEFKLRKCRVYCNWDNTTAVSYPFKLSLGTPPIFHSNLVLTSCLYSHSWNWFVGYRLFLVPVTLRYTMTQQTDNIYCFSFFPFFLLWNCLVTSI